MITEKFSDFPKHFLEKHSLEEMKVNESVLKVIVPECINAIKETTKTEEGAENLLQFLHEEDASESEKIIAHLFGENFDPIASRVSTQTQIDRESAKKIMKLVSLDCIGHLATIVKSEKLNPHQLVNYLNGKETEVPTLNHYLEMRA